MPHITLLPDVPGIRALLSYRPETAKPLSELAEVLLRGPSTLTRAERELIAAYVSHRNACHFCQASHSAIAAAHLGGREEDYATVEQVKADPGAAPISEKLRASD